MTGRSAGNRVTIFEDLASKKVRKMAFSIVTDTLSEWLYNMGQNSPKFLTGQVPVWSQNQYYIFTQ